MKATLTALAAATALADPALAEDAIRYNCPPEGADWASMLAAVEDRLGVSMPRDNKNSGQALSQLIAEAAAPVADVA